MSQWTHIRGGLELVSTPYEKKKAPKSLVQPKREDFESDEAFDKADRKYGYELRKLLYFPYPEEQFKLEMPRPYVSYGKKKKDGTREKFNTIEFEAKVYSLPRARKYIEEAFKLMPYGESGLRYSLDQNATDSSSSCSGFMMPCEFEAYKNAVTKMYYSADPWHSLTYEQLHAYFHIEEECSVDSVNHILIGIRDDIRHASAQEVQEGLEKVFQYLLDNDIEVEDGYLEWIDEFDPEHIYAWRYSRLSGRFGHQFLVLDKKTNQIVHSKTWVAQMERDEAGHLLYQDDENGHIVYKIVEQDGPCNEED